MPTPADTFRSVMLTGEISDLEAACRKLRQTLDFRPSLHQVLEALEVAKQEAPD